MNAPKNVGKLTMSYGEMRETERTKTVVASKGMTRARMATRVLTSGHESERHPERVERLGIGR